MRENEHGRKKILLIQHCLPAEGIFIALTYTKQQLWLLERLSAAPEMVSIT